MVLDSNRGIGLGTGTNTINIVPGATLTYGGIIDNYGPVSGSLRKTGDGILNLLGACNFTGGLTITAGQVIIEDAPTFAASAITNNSPVADALTFQGFTALTVNATISGTGGLTKAGGGNLTLGGSGANTYAGPTSSPAAFSPCRRRAAFAIPETDRQRQLLRCFGGPSDPGARSGRRRSSAPRHRSARPLPIRSQPYLTVPVGTGYANTPSRPR